MYNLLMVGCDGYWDEQDVSTFEYDRFFSYTHEAIITKFEAARGLQLSS
jgi:hypothetical protein